MTDNCGRDAALRRPRPCRAGGIVGKFCSIERESDHFYKGKSWSGLTSAATKDMIAPLDTARTAQRAVPTCFFCHVLIPKKAA